MKNLKCPNKKTCKKIYKRTFINGFICCGQNLKPTIHPLDKIKMCIKSSISDSEQELTALEASIIVSGLGMVITELQKPIKKRI